MFTVYSLSVYPKDRSFSKLWMQEIYYVLGFWNNEICWGSKFNWRLRIFSRFDMDMSGCKVLHGKGNHSATSYQLENWSIPKHKTGRANNLDMAIQPIEGVWSQKITRDLQAEHSSDREIRIKNSSDAHHHQTLVLVKVLHLLYDLT